MHRAAKRVCDSFNTQESVSRGPKILLASSRDCPKIFSLVNTAYKLEIGSSGVAFKQDDRFLAVEEVDDLIGRESCSDVCMVKLEMHQESGVEVLVGCIGLQWVRSSRSTAIFLFSETLDESCLQSILAAKVVSTLVRWPCCRPIVEEGLAS